MTINVRRTERCRRHKCTKFGGMAHSEMEKTIFWSYDMGAIYATRFVGCVCVLLTAYGNGCGLVDWWLVCAYFYSSALSSIFNFVFFSSSFLACFYFPLHIGKCEVNSSEIVVFGWLAAMVVVGVRTSMDRVVVHIVWMRYFIPNSFVSRLLLAHKTESRISSTYTHFI